MTGERRPSALSTLWRGLVPSGSIDDSSSPRSDCPDAPALACACSAVKPSGVLSELKKAGAGGGAGAPIEVSEALADLRASNPRASPPLSYTVHSVADGCAKDAVEELVGRTQTPRSSTTCSGSTTHCPGALPASVEEGDLFGAVETLSQAQSCCFSTTALDLGLDSPHAEARSSGRNGVLPTQADILPGGQRTYAPHKRFFGRFLRRCSVLHFLALFHSFVMVVSLWGILASAVELLAAGSTTAQLSWYCGMLAAALSATLLLKLTERQGYACTFYPTLFAMLAMLVAAWGIIVRRGPLGLTTGPADHIYKPLLLSIEDVLVEVAGNENKHLELVFYFLVFIVAALLVLLHTCFCDRGFGEQLHRFVCI